MQSCPNCHQCEHFKTSWDPKNPYGCRKFGFKCRQLPSYEVLATTVDYCIFFEPRASGR